MTEVAEVEDQAQDPSPEEVQAALRIRRRIALLGGGGMFAVYLLYIVLTAFTAALDGTVGGIGIAYLVGFAQVALAFSASLYYRRWANRLEER